MPRSISASPVPLPAQSVIAPSRSFDPEASIVLIGVPGTGKSTLGIIVSTSFQRRLIDTEWAFQETTSQSSAAYKKMFGVVEHQRRQYEVLKSVLMNNEKGCVIVCSTSSIEKRGQIFLREYAKTHPVVYIVRDAKSIQEHVKVLEEEKVAEILKISGSLFRACSNFEFFNLSESRAIHDSSGESGASLGVPFTLAQKHGTPFLVLKKAESHFLKFITLITKGSIPSLESTYPLSRVPAHARSFTHAVSVPLSALSSSASKDVEGLASGADAFEIVVDDLRACKPLSGVQSNNATLTYTTVYAKYSGSTVSSTQIDEVSKAFARVRRSVILPILYHVDFTRGAPSETSNGGQPQSIANDLKRIYLNLLYHGLRLAPEFATVDLSLDDTELLRIMDAKGSTKLIAHYRTNGQTLSWENTYWLSAYERARRLGFDLVRLCRPALAVEDNFAVQAFRQKIASMPPPHIPLIAYNTGRLGRMSICFNPTLTPVTHEDIQKASRDHLSTTITARQATEALYASFVFDPMKFYIIGASAGHSMSPAMHHACYDVCGMPHTYEIYQTPTLNDLRVLAENPYFGGASIALPFKLEVIALTHSLSPHARAIGAVNTLIPVRHLRPDGSIPDDLSLLSERSRAGPVRALYGENTDWIGIRACIRRGLSPANAVRPKTAGLIIGAGGMAHATVYAMLQLGVRNIAIYNRTLANAEKIVAHFRRLIDTAGNSPSSSQILPSSTTGIETTFHVLRSREEPWPGTFRQPTIVVSSIPNHSVGDVPAPNFTLPDHWLRSPTGGVVLEVRPRFSFFAHLCNY